MSGYGGYARPYLERAIELNAKGKTSSEIARILIKEGCINDTKDVNGRDCQTFPQSGLVTYMLRREGILPATGTVVDRWSDILPKVVADRQRRWEKARFVQRAIACGLTHTDIEIRFGITKNAVKNLLVCLRNGGAAPVEKYFSEPPLEVAAFFMSHRVRSSMMVELADAGIWPI